MQIVIMSPQKQEVISLTLAKKISGNEMSLEAMRDHLMQETDEVLRRIKLTIGVAHQLVDMERPADASCLLRMMLDACGYDDRVRHYLATILQRNGVHASAEKLLDDPPVEPENIWRFYLLRAQLQESRKNAEGVLSVFHECPVEHRHPTLYVCAIHALNALGRGNEIKALLKEVSRAQQKKIYGAVGGNGIVRGKFTPQHESKESPNGAASQERRMVV